MTVYRVTHMNGCLTMRTTSAEQARELQAEGCEVEPQPPTKVQEITARLAVWLVLGLLWWVATEGGR